MAHAAFPSLRRSTRRRALLACVVLTAFAVAAPISAAEVTGRSLRFVAEDQSVRVIELDALRSSCGEQTVVVEDPYYHREKRFIACPIRAVLEMGFDLDASTLARRSFLLRALDGYTKPAAGAVLLGEGGYIAFADAELSDPHAIPFVPRFEPIDRRQVDPAPFYMVWTGVDADAAHEKPWPYQLATIEIASFERAFARAAPSGLPPDDPGWRGFERFVSECIACHSVNGQGGKVGPELNVPRSIVEYRDPQQLMAFIRDPESFRHTSMPSHLHLKQRDLEDLIAYFRAMSERKDDPGAREDEG